MKSVFLKCQKQGVRIWQVTTILYYPQCEWQLCELIQRKFKLISENLSSGSVSLIKQQDRFGVFKPSLLAYQHH